MIMFPYLPDSSISNSVVLSFAGISSQGNMINSPTNKPKMTYTANLLKMAIRMYIGDINYKMLYYEAN